MIKSIFYFLIATYIYFILFFKLKIFFSPIGMNQDKRSTEVLGHNEEVASGVSKMFKDPSMIRLY